jgi:hypothetical protein
VGGEEGVEPAAAFIRLVHNPVRPAITKNSGNGNILPRARFAAGSTHQDRT